MPAKTSSVPQDNETDTNAFLQDYLADFDDDDPFRSPSPEPGAGGASKKTNNTSNNKKRKEPDTLGIDEQIDLKKKPRVPRVKLDETRLLSEKGIPALRKKAPKLRLKGKGHEFSDAARLLSFYQEWLDDLFPKANFLDALAMVEKTGHKTIIRNERLKWIEEGKPKPAVTAEDEDDPFRDESAPRQPTRIAPIFEKSAARPGTPPNPDDDLFGDEDIYGATPKRQQTNGAGAGVDVPDDDDLDALMAEAEANGPTQAKDTTTSRIPAFGSIFGGGGVTATIPTVQPSGEPDDDDLDALMAEAEAVWAPAPAKGAPVSIFGGGRPKETGPVDEDDDLDALMAEAEAQAEPLAKGTDGAKATLAASGNSGGGSKGKEGEKQGDEFDDDDQGDLDALMAEAEGLATGSASATTSKPDVGQKKNQSFEDDEEAMAEMDGLW